MKNSGAGDKHINNNLEIVLSFASFSDPNLSFEVYFLTYVNMRSTHDKSEVKNKII